MNSTDSNKSLIFQNPEFKPLEELKLKVDKNGIVQIIPALDKYWVEKKCFLKYEAPSLTDSEGQIIIGAKERWLEIVTFMLDDLVWLLHLPFYKFWSNVIYNSSIMESIISFLEEAPPFYMIENVSNDCDIKENFYRLRHKILIVFTRLITNKESLAEYISSLEHARLLYEKYLITIPILMDLCQQYGRDNKKIIRKIVNSLFSLQPLYKRDLETATEFIIQALRNIERRFEDCPIDQEAKPILLSERGGASIEITLLNLQDMILYLLDIVSTINILIDIYPPSINNFKIETFIVKIISIYGNTIPEMYKKLNHLTFKDETIGKFIDLKYRLDITRIEILNIYRKILYNPINDIFEAKNSISKSEIGDIIENFLTNLMHILLEKEFVIDYHNLYPITNDFQNLFKLYPELDTVKCEFIINSIFTFIDEPNLCSVPTSFGTVSTCRTTSENVDDNKIVDTEDKSSAAYSSQASADSVIKLKCHIAEIKDILCDLGEGFIQKCLEYYNYNKESVINAVLENNLPVELKSLDHDLPFIPPDSKEILAAADNVIGVQRLNIFDNDEFDVMSRDIIDTSRIHKGKRKDKYRNLNELLNDKSYIAETKNIYNKYSIITTEYEDEYDDTYDDQDISSSAQDDIVELDVRPFTTPRVLRKQETNDSNETEEESDLNSISENISNKDNFVEDPALIRYKAEQKRLMKQRVNTVNCQNKAIGNPKGQGQTKEVTICRDNKNKHKATRGNHNRRVASQRKRNYGTVPS